MIPSPGRGAQCSLTYRRKLAGRWSRGGGCTRPRRRGRRRRRRRQATSPSAESCDNCSQYKQLASSFRKKKSDDGDAEMGWGGASGSPSPPGHHGCASAARVAAGITPPSRSPFSILPSLFPMQLPDCHLSRLALGVGKIYREPRTEPKLPRTGTEGTGTEKVRFPFGSMIRGTEVSQ